MVLGGVRLAACTWPSIPIFAYPPFRPGLHVEGIGRRGVPREGVTSGSWKPSASEGEASSSQPSGLSSEGREAGPGRPADRLRTATITTPAADGRCPRGRYPVAPFGQRCFTLLQASAARTPYIMQDAALELRQISSNHPELLRRAMSRLDRHLTFDTYRTALICDCLIAFFRPPVEKDD